VWRCYASLGRAALPAFATVAESESLAELSARQTECGVPNEGDAQ
jgi:hypothetical protein